MSQLVPGRPYKLVTITRATTRFGDRLRGVIVDDQSSVGRTLIFFPERFNRISEKDLRKLKKDASSSEGLFIVFKGRFEGADIVELI